MKSTTTLMLAMLIVASLTLGQDGQTRSRQPPPVNNDSRAASLVGTCEIPGSVPEYYSMCAGWMNGLMLGIDASESLKDNRSICFPVRSPNEPTVHQEDLRKIFAKYVAANPKKLDVHIGSVAYQAFLEAFPCKK
jgi:hypothetical protein